MISAFILTSSFRHLYWHPLHSTAYVSFKMLANSSEVTGNTLQSLKDDSLSELVPTRSRSSVLPVPPSGTGASGVLSKGGEMRCLISCKTAAQMEHGEHLLLTQASLDPDPLPPFYSVSPWQELPVMGRNHIEMPSLSNIALQSKIRWILGLTTWTIFKYRAYRESFATVITFSAGASVCCGCGAVCNINIGGNNIKLKVEGQYICLCVCVRYVNIYIHHWGSLYRCTKFCLVLVCSCESVGLSNVTESIDCYILKSRNGGQLLTEWQYLEHDPYKRMRRM